MRGAAWANGLRRVRRLTLSTPARGPLDARRLAGAGAPAVAQAEGFQWHVGAAHGFSFVRDVLSGVPGALASASDPQALWALARAHPVHLFIELTLAVFIGYITLVKKAYDPTKRCVLAAARAGAGGAPSAASSGARARGAPVTRRSSPRTPLSSLRLALPRSGYGGRGMPELSEKEREELLAEWQPEPLGASLERGERTADCGARGGAGRAAGSRGTPRGATRSWPAGAAGAASSGAPSTFKRARLH